MKRIVLLFVGLVVLLSCNNSQLETEFLNSEKELEKTTGGNSAPQEATQKPTEGITTGERDSQRGGTSGVGNSSGGSGAEENTPNQNTTNSGHNNGNSGEVSPGTPEKTGIGEGGNGKGTETGQPVGPTESVPVSPPPTDGGQESPPFVDDEDEEEFIPPCVIPSTIDGQPVIYINGEPSVVISSGVVTGGFHFGNDKWVNNLNFTFYGNIYHGVDYDNSIGWYINPGVSDVTNTHVKVEKDGVITRGNWNPGPNTEVFYFTKQDRTQYENFVKTWLDTYAVVYLNITGPDTGDWWRYNDYLESSNFLFDF